MPAVATKTRIQLKNILFATDFSWAANAAVPYVKEIAQHFGSRIVAVHIRPPVVNPMTYPTSWPVFIEAAESENKRHRMELLAQFPGETTEVIIEEGNPLTQIPAVLEKKHVDLMVMGTHGRTGVPRLVLGSVAEEMFRKVECPVLTVGPNSLMSNGMAGEFREILFATDFNAGSLSAFDYALSLAQEFQAQLTLLHVIPEAKSGELVSDAELEEAAKNRLRKLIPEGANDWCKANIIVERGEAGEKILDIAKRRNADLIVLGVSEEKGIPGACTHLPIAIAHTVVAHAICPVLTVRG
ncbi:MAG TPA: universal stress protein [Verrucomicrobiae bacterium]|nr:universal stress protein [Verrucomicrobiae bacterium]